MSIWRRWPVAELQREIGEDLLKKIGQVLPIISSDPDVLFFETNKKGLEKVLEAFSSNDYFRKVENVEKCLNYLDASTFENLRRALNLFSVEKMCQEVIHQTALEITKSSVKFELFAKFFGISDRFLHHKKENRPSLFIAKFPSPDFPIQVSTSYKTLKEYQCDIYFRALQELQPRMARLILQMPTGSGKTRTAMELICSHLVDSELAPRRVVWLANSTELCEQAIACFEDVWCHVGKFNVEVQRMWGGYKKPLESDFSLPSQFIVASLQTLWSALKSKDAGVLSVISSTTLLIVDEAHIAVAPTYAEVVREIARTSMCRIIGLTATPGRTNEAEVPLLSDLFNDVILSLRDPSGRNSNPVSYLRSMKVLSRVKYEQLIVSESVALTESEIAKLESEFDFPESVLKRIGRSALRSAEVLLKLLPHLKSGSSILLFAPSVESSKFLTSMFTFLGYGSAHIDGATSPHIRNQLVKEFVEGKIQLLCNYGVLTTGFDAPKTDVVCIARPTKSVVLYSQMIGRGMRGSAVGGTEECVIVEVKDNFLGLGTQDDLYVQFNEYWE